MLSEKAIQKLIIDKKLLVTPVAEVKETSIKIHISSQFGKSKDTFEVKDKYILKPKEFVLAYTKENIVLPTTHSGLYDGHIDFSSKGLMTHMGSMLIEPGFSGNILLEIFNASDNEVSLKEGDRVGNLMIFKIDN